LFGVFIGHVPTNIRENFCIPQSKKTACFLFGVNAMVDRCVASGY
jgi:hypothetical protein